MKHRVLFVCLVSLAASGCVSLAASGCASTAKMACGAVAPASEGWELITAPENAAELLVLGGAELPKKVLWYQRQQGQLRACVYQHCGSIGYDFSEQDGKWSGGPNVLTHCHKRGGA